MELKHQILASEPIALVRMEGKLALEAVQVAKRYLDDLMKSNSFSHLALDFSLVPMLDSSAMGFLVMAHKTLHAHQGKLALYGVNSKVYKIFEMTRLDTLIRIFPDEALALQYLRDHEA